ncbi:MAG: hypothetical protein LBC20_03035 [Planctomycetaceae bacterium]|jgi:hypothetical protein|nr:hypothetical protein [Planctomycetaceae bacterium]
MPAITTGATSLDVLKINNSEEIIGVIDDAIKTIPELGYFDASPVTRNAYKTLVITALPKVGFRTPGTFAEQKAAVLAARDVQCAHLDASWSIDDALATQSDWGKDTAFAIETTTHLRAAFFTLSRQIWYGTNTVAGDTAGFPGLYQLIGGTAPNHSNADLHIDAGAAKARQDAITNEETPVDTNLTSVFAVTSGLDGIQIAWGSEGMITQGDVVKQQLMNSAGNMAWFDCQQIECWAGLQVTSEFAFGRIHGINKNYPLTDDLLYELLSRFPSGKEPTAIFMNRYALEQLRRSRTAVNATGAPAPRPDEVSGVKIYVTDAILNNEETLSS